MLQQNLITLRKEKFFSVTMSHQMIKDLLFQFLFLSQIFWVKMHFVLLLIHSGSKVKYKIPNLYRPPKILMDSGKFWEVAYMLHTVTTCTEHFTFVKDCKRWNGVDVLQVLDL